MTLPMLTSTLSTVSNCYSILLSVIDGIIKMKGLDLINLTFLSFLCKKRMPLLGALSLCRKGISLLPL